MCKLFRLLALCTSLSVTAAAECRGDIVWESLGWTDEQAVASGTELTNVNNRVTLNWLAFSDSDGGTYDLSVGRNTSFLTYESGITGNHAGYLEMSFDNQNDDPADYLELQMNFFYPTVGLQFSLLDVDRGLGNSFADGVEVFYNGINVRTNPALFAFGSDVALDNESYLNGFEGIDTATTTATSGNINFDFGATVVNSLTIRYRSSDDAQANPVAQFIGISDMVYTSIPEPAMWGCLAAIGLGMGTLLRRRVA